jgi:hypothetical protein
LVTTNFWSNPAIFMQIQESRISTTSFFVDTNSNNTVPLLYWYLIWLPIHISLYGLSQLNEIHRDSKWFFIAVIIQICSLTYFSLVISFSLKIQAKVRLWQLDVLKKGTIVLSRRFYIDGKNKPPANMALHRHTPFSPIWTDDTSGMHCNMTRILNCDMEITSISFQWYALVDTI